MRERKPFVLKRRIVEAVAVLLVPTSLIFAWITTIATRQIEAYIADANLASLQLYVNTLQNEIMGTEKFLGALVYENELMREFTVAEELDADALYTGQLSELLSGAFQNNTDLTALAVYQKSSGKFRIKFNSIVLYESIEPEVRELVRQQMEKGDVALGWFLAKENDHHYLCRVVEKNGCLLMALYSLPQVVTNASIFYEQKGELVLFTRQETLANEAFLEQNNLQLDYTRQSEHYFLGPSRAYIVVQEQLINFKVALIEPYATVNGTLRVLYISPFLYITIALAALGVELLYLHRTLFVPLEQLVRVMRQLQGGDLNARLPRQESIEMIQIEQTFNATVSELITLRIQGYEQQLELEQAQLNGLKMQIRPHFYLNCLKGIYGLAQTGKTARIQEAVLCLSRHLRYVMDVDTDLITLERELQMCENYIHLQRECEYGNPNLEISVDPMAYGIQLPPVSLLTFVENCIKHGTQNEKPLKIRISAKLLECDGQRSADIIVSDNGPGFPPEVLEEFSQETAHKGGIGVKNVVRRMKLLYGENCLLRFYNDGGAHIEIMLVLDTQKEGEHHDDSADR